MNQVNKNLICALALCLCVSMNLYGQVSGNIVFNKNRNSNFPLESHSQQISLLNNYVQLNDTTMVIEAKVLKNIAADYFVVVFAASQEELTLLECNTKLDKRINGFVQSAQRKLNIPSKHFHIDLITQNRVYAYDYDINKKISRERISGYEYKKNIAIRLSDKKDIDRLAVLASEYGIFDIVKVDYLVEDQEKIIEELFDTSIKVIERKRKRYLMASDVALVNKGRLQAESMRILTPKNQYQQYNAFQSHNIVHHVGYRSRSDYTRIEARKMTTYYYNPFDGEGYDRVINPVVLEPQVQFLYSIKMVYKVKKANS